MQTALKRQSRIDSAGRAYAGSQRQIQFYVNQQPQALNRAIEDAFGRTFDLRWVSPLASDLYREYRDAQFLASIGMNHHMSKLKDFWPKNGPVWDALAIATGDAVVLVEAKSHIPEMYAGSCTAKSKRSLAKIDVSLGRTREWLAASKSANWLGAHTYEIDGEAREGCLYQLANRVAHLYFLRQIAGIEAWLVNLCFVHDPRTPTSMSEWQVALGRAKASLGIKSVPCCADVFLPAIA